MTLTTESTSREEIARKKIESNRILTKYPDRIPVICNSVKNSNLPELDKKKYLVPRDLTVGQMLYVIRKRLQLRPEQALFLFVNKNIIPPTSSLMYEIYDKYKNEDNFLYCVYSGENAFGN